MTDQGFPQQYPEGGAPPPVSHQVSYQEKDPAVFGQAPPPAAQPQADYPPQQGYAQQGYPPEQQGYPPQQQGGYPPEQGYPPQQQGYPPQQQQQGYPPQQQGYPPQQAPVGYGYGAEKQYPGGPPPYAAAPAMQPPPAQMQQQSTNVVVVQQQQPQVVTTVVPARRVYGTGDHGLVYAFIATFILVIFGWWIGLACTIPAIFIALNAQNSASSGNAAEAITQTRISRILSSVGVSTLVIFWVIIILIIAVPR